MVTSKETVIAVIGLGYVGLPLAVEFGKKYRTIGYDHSKPRIDSCKKGIDPSNEINTEELSKATRLNFTSDPCSLSEADFVIVAVPTPVDHAHIPDFSPLVNASIIIGQNMKEGATIIYESTVFPGATEEVCIPVIEKNSGRKWRFGFNIGYSPERINPGDKHRTLTNVTKIVSGDSPETLDRVSKLYESIVVAGVHRASSIKVAEAAKVIENIQRDLNIALMNELAIIFDRIKIDTTEILEAAGTKWNFLKFKPGLVGGHCIGVDPYYLTHKAEMLGYHPQVILAGRRINDGMGKFIAEKTIKTMIQSGVTIEDAKVIVLGLTFKENCSDIRNSKVPDIVRELETYGVDVFVSDPLACSQAAHDEYSLKIVPFEDLPQADVLVVAVAHDDYVKMPLDDLLSRLKTKAVVIDVKSVLPEAQLVERGLGVWRL